MTHEQIPLENSADKIDFEKEKLYADILEKIRPSFAKEFGAANWPRIAEAIEKYFNETDKPFDDEIFQDVKKNLDDRILQVWEKIPILLVALGLMDISEQSKLRQFEIYKLGWLERNQGGSVFTTEDKSNIIKVDFGK